MLNFVNNWQSPVELAIGATAAQLELPDGEYRITITDAAGAGATRREIIGAMVAAGSATLTRGLEGTAAQGWPVGSIAYIDITADTLRAMQQATSDAQSVADNALETAQTALASGGMEIVDGFGAPPSQEPPSVGALYVESGQYLEVPIYLAAGDLAKDDWVGPLASYGGNRFQELSYPDTVNLPVSIGRVHARQGAGQSAGTFKLQLNWSSRVQKGRMLEFSILTEASAGSNLVIETPYLTTAFSVSGPAVGHTTTSSAITIPMKTMELRVSFCVTEANQRKVHVFVQHLVA